MRYTKIAPTSPLLTPITASPVMTWYVDRDRTRWRRCVITGRVFSRVTVMTYDGTPLQGVARRGWDGNELVTEV